MTVISIEVVALFGKHRNDAAEPKPGLGTARIELDGAAKVDTGAVHIASDRGDAPALDDWKDFGGCWFDHGFLKMKHA